MPYSDIPASQRTPAGRRKLVEYCIWDSVLPFALATLHMAVLRYMKLAFVTGLPMDTLFEKGQQIRFHSLLLRKARQRQIANGTRWRYLVASMGYSVPEVPKDHAVDEDEEAEEEASPAKRKVKYQGATVLEPSVGRHAMTATLDYASLYPR